MRLLALFFLPLFAIATGALMLTTLIVAACFGPAIRAAHPHLDDKE